MQCNCPFPTTRICPIFPWGMVYLQEVKQTFHVFKVYNGFAMFQKMEDHHKLNKYFCNSIWTLGNMNLFNPLMLAIIVVIVITNQNFGMRNQGFFLVCTFLQILSNLRFIILSAPSTREQILQRTMWIFPIRSTTGSTQEIGQPIHL